MSQHPFRWLLRLFLLFSFLGILGLAAAALATHYLFQEPAQVTWSRYLLPEFRWQRQKYPSVRWAFDLVEPFLNASDPRDRFTAGRPIGALAGPEAWDNALAGPRALPPGSPRPSAAVWIQVASNTELRSAISAARPGTLIEILPGSYDFSGGSIDIVHGGEPDLPIRVWAAQPGSVRLRFSLLEGFHVRAPHWIFENLVIEGTCDNDSRCEHAFHVVGAGSHVVIRNNWVSEFNAAIKVNGRDGRFPDAGLVEYNALVNSRPRATSNPVTPIDAVAASGWRVRKNLIADFAKAGGDRVSYGAFFKGAGEDNVFEQNVVRCEWQHWGGTRIGFSFGGGGSGSSATHCRDGRCRVEHRGGIARNNIIMNCPNDVGIYLNMSADTRIQNNTLAKTRGIDVRFPQSDAVIVNNIVDGRILAREGARISKSDNIESLLKALFLGKVTDDIYGNAPQGDFRLKSLDAVQGRGAPVPEGGPDLCGQPYRDGKPDAGPIQHGPQMACVPLIP